MNSPTIGSAVMRPVRNRSSVSLAVGWTSSGPGALMVVAVTGLDYKLAVPREGDPCRA